MKAILKWRQLQRRRDDFSLPRDEREKNPDECVRSWPDEKSFPSIKEAEVYYDNDMSVDDDVEDITLFAGGEKRFLNKQIQCNMADGCFNSRACAHGHAHEKKRACRNIGCAIMPGAKCVVAKGVKVKK